MVTGWDRTLSVLQDSGNRAAQLLLAHLVLHAPARHAQAAFETLVAKKDRRAVHLLVARFDQIPRELRPRLLALGEELGFALREAYLSEEEQPYRNACDLILDLPAYDQISLILGSIHHETPRRRDAEHLIRQLGEKLAAELDGDQDKRSRADIDRVRQQFLAALEPALARFAHHKMTVVPETYLLLADEESELVRKILLEPNHTCHGPMVDAIRHRQEIRFGRWILASLRWRHTPPALLQTISHRRDAWFRQLLLSRIDDLAEPAVAQAIRKIREFSWLSPRVLNLRSLNEQEQRSLVILATSSGMRLEAKLDLLGRVLAEGLPVARQAAAASLYPLQGTDASALVLQCLHDRDPIVQLAAVQQARGKHLPQLVSILMEKLDHPDPRLQQAARDGLKEEFNFDRYTRSFDQLDDRSRLAVGQVVQRVEPDFGAELRRYLVHEHRSHQIRGAKIIQVLGLGNDYWRELLSLVEHDDLIIRRAAIDALLTADAPEMIHALQPTSINPSQESRSLIELRGTLGSSSHSAAVRAALEPFSQPAPLVASTRP